MPVDCLYALQKSRGDGEDYLLKVVEVYLTLGNRNLRSSCRFFFARVADLYTSNPHHKMVL